MPLAKTLPWQQQPSLRQHIEAAKSSGPDHPFRVALIAEKLLTRIEELENARAADQERYAATIAAIHKRLDKLSGTHGA